jgi:hypothetical protein
MIAQERVPALTSFMPIDPAAIIPPVPIVFSGAGDISICGQEEDDRTAALLPTMTGYIFTLGG